MRVAALYDVHGNLPALDAVLDDVAAVSPDAIVVGGDVVPGPFPRESLERLLRLDRPTYFVVGNGELAMLAQMAAASSGAPVTYWGTTSGGPIPEPYLGVYRWTAAQLAPDYEPVLSRWPKSVRLDVAGLGPVLFCHGTPRSETEVFTRDTPEARLLPLFDGAGASVVVCGHTHMQFDRRIGATRVVNAGSVGAPYGEPGAYWLLLGPDVELRRTAYDLGRAADRIRATPYPQANAFAAEILRPRAESEMREVFERWALNR